MQGTNTGRHYLDYYSDWSLALINAKQLIDMKLVDIKGTAFIGILNELWDADQISAERLIQYTTEVNQMTQKKYSSFYN